MFINWFLLGFFSHTVSSTSFDIYSNFSLFSLLLLLVLLAAVVSFRKQNKKIWNKKNVCRLLFIFILFSHLLRPNKQTRIECFDRSCNMVFLSSTNGNNYKNTQHTQVYCHMWTCNGFFYFLLSLSISLFFYCLVKSSTHSIYINRKWINRNQTATIHNGMEVNEWTNRARKKNSLFLFKEFAYRFDCGW